VIAEGEDPGWARKLAQNPAGAARTLRELALVRFALRLTLAPATCSRETLDALRAQGMSDADLHDATQVIAYFNYINRVADGLGVADEPDWGSE